MTEFQKMTHAGATGPRGYPTLVMREGLRAGAPGTGSAPATAWPDAALVEWLAA